MVGFPDCEAGEGEGFGARLDGGSQDLATCSVLWGTISGVGLDIPFAGYCWLGESPLLSCSRPGCPESLGAYPCSGGCYQVPPGPSTDRHHAEAVMRCLRFIKFSRLHLHKPLYKGPAREPPAHPGHLWQRPPGVHRALHTPCQPQPFSDQTHNGSQEVGQRTKHWFLYNQIFTALSDRFLSHLKDLFLCESISVMQ